MKESVNNNLFTAEIARESLIPNPIIMTHDIIIHERETANRAAQTTVEHVRKFKLTWDNRGEDREQNQSRKIVELGRELEKRKRVFFPSLDIRRWIVYPDVYSIYKYILSK